MLASVVDELELAAAIEAGADIIDLKNPHAGALGALPNATIRRLVTICASRLPVSATVGDLPAEAQRLTSAIRETADCGVDYVKVGFFSNDNLSQCLRAIAALTLEHDVVAVLFADREPPLHKLREFADAGFRGVMLDTAGKRGGGLLEQIGTARLEEFVDEVRSLDMISGLAGSLRLEDISRLLPFAPDYLGFRGALCEGSERTARISASRLRMVRDAVSQSPSRIGQAVFAG
jgi:dihydroneopterin aldolase